MCNKFTLIKVSFNNSLLYYIVSILYKRGYLIIIVYTVIYSSLL